MAGRDAAVRDIIAALFGALLGTLDLGDPDPRTPEDLVAARRDVVTELPRILSALEARRCDEAVERITALSQALQARIGRAEAADAGSPAR